MTNIDEARKRISDDLLDGAKNGYCSGGGYTYIEVLPEDARTVLDALDALDAAVRERDEALAVIGRALDAATDSEVRSSVALAAVREILTAVPADVLRERDAEKWREGFQACDEWDAASMSTIPQCPYRETKEQD